MARQTQKNTKVKVDPQIKSFKNSSEIETFYRFIHENSMRHEAKVLIGTILKKLKKKPKKSKNLH